jgi:transposase
LLDKELGQVEWLEAQVVTLEQEIERRVTPFEEPIQRLITVPGIERKTAWTIVAEIGVDMSVSPDARHLASWAGLCPGNRESAGKRMSGRSRKANRYVKRALCQAAWAASHTKDTFLSAFHRRLLARKGSPKAVIALAHHLITVVYQILSRGEAYIEMGGDYYDRRNKPKVVARLIRRLTLLGYYVQLQPVEDDPSPPEAPEDTHTTLVARKKRGRPCKCSERGIICKHTTSEEVNSLIPQSSSTVKFS